MCDEYHTEQNLREICLPQDHIPKHYLSPIYMQKSQIQKSPFLHALFKLIHYFCISRYLLEFRNYDNVMENGNAATKVLKTEMRLIIEDRLDNMG